MRNGCTTAVILFTGDTRREERRKRLPRRLLARVHADLARIAGAAGDLFVCGDAQGLPLVRGTFDADGPLAQQVSRAVDAVLACGYTKVMLLAGDVAGLRSRHLEEAERALRSGEPKAEAGASAGRAAAALPQSRRAVIGRCRDGGFYLAAFNAEPRINWHAMPWFGATVAADLAARLTGDGFEVGELDVLEDIDDISVARRVMPSRIVTIPTFEITTFLPAPAPAYAPLYRRPPPF